MLSRGAIIIIFFIGLIIFSHFAVGGIGFKFGYTPDKFQNSTDPSQAKLIPISNPSAGPQKNLQLDSLRFVTTAPTVIPTRPPVVIPTQPPQTTRTCASHSIKQPDCNCPYGEDIWVYCPLGDENACHNDSGFTSPYPNDNSRMACTYSPIGEIDGVVTPYDRKLNDPSCTQYCYGKPVIYLYPQQPTYVDVKLSIPGDVTISIPHYPDQGWKKVLAYPDGKLIYQDKEYKELYYETSVPFIPRPQKGIILPKNTVKESLSDVMTQFGLIPSERDEFLEYWMPRLEKLNTNYIFFSVYEKEQKELVDHVNITPQPDTFIELLVYFKPVDLTFKYTSMMPPKNVPQRIGFTAVEWGGTIDSDSSNTHIY